MFVRYGAQLRASSHYAQEALAIFHGMQSDKAETDDTSEDLPIPEVALARTSSADGVPRFDNGSFLETSEGQLSSSDTGRASTPTIQCLETEQTVSQ